MRTHNLLRQALFFGPLVLGAVGVILLPSRTVAPGVVFLSLAIYAHAGAWVLSAKGPEKAMLFLETLPFFGLAVVSLGKLEASPALVLVGSGTVAGAAILAGEWLLAKGTATFSTSLSFIAACCAVGVGIAELPAMLFLGLALLALAVAGYGVARRVHG